MEKNFDSALGIIKTQFVCLASQAGNWFDSLNWIKLFFIGYLGVIAIFSLIYYGCWQWNPDQFITTPDINLDYTYLSKKIDLYLKNESLGDKEEFNDISIAKNEILRLQKKIDNTISKDIFPQLIELSENRNSFFATWASLPAEPLRRKCVALNSFIQHYHDNPSRDELYLQLATEQGNRAISDNKLQIALTSNLQVASGSSSVIIAIENNFKAIQEKLKNCKKEDMSKEENSMKDRLQANNIEALTKDIKPLYKSLSTNINHMTRLRKGVLGLLDFVYFSTITATTTGYGDITPNSTLVRVAALLEIILCMSIWSLIFVKIGQKIAYDSGASCG